VLGARTGGGVTKPDLVWAIGRPTLGTIVRLLAPLRNYGSERVPREGGVVLALNHFSWLDPPAFGTACPRTIFYMAKSEIHEVRAVGPLIRGFGAFAVRRGESDREAVRLAREVVRDGNALGLFVEGTRQRSGVPGEAKSGAAMIALHEQVPIVPAAIHGSQHWKFGTFRPVSVAWGTPLRFDGLAPGGRAYREVSSEIETRIRALWEFLVDIHARGRPRRAQPPA
jgi:1-acyl-sn-glycerol-3-phosphate acyltransferase